MPNSTSRTAVLVALLVVLAPAPVGRAMEMFDPRALDIDPATATGPIAPRLEGLGDHTMKVTTSSEDSQYFFDQGLRLTYGFNHSEALRAFKEAVRLDPNNAMAYWGWAFALGPNINLPMQPDVAEQAFAATQKAVALKASVTPREAAWIDALAKRYAPVAPDDRSALDAAFAEAMGEVAQAYPDDLDAATLHGDALMNLSPWNYWEGDGEPREHTGEIVAAFERVLAADPEHPGAIHLYIHAMELIHPARAEGEADVLLGLMPSAGHMVHMPSHIYMRVGRYADAYKVNRMASDADADYIAQCKAQGIYPLNYYPHNLHFMVWAAMFQGRSEVALAGAREVEKQIPHHMVEGFSSLQIFLAQPMYVMVRFGMWERALAEPAPPADMHFMKGVWHYMRGTAYSATGNARAARKELDALERLRNDLPDDYVIGFASASTLLEIAELLLAGDIDSRSGDHDEAIAKLSKAARVEDSLLYSEPPDWYFPTRHVLGWALLEAGDANEAEAVFWQDLRKHPRNGYALLGVAQAMKAQDKPDAERYDAAFREAWRDADVRLSSSRY